MRAFIAGLILAAMAALTAGQAFDRERHWAPDQRRKLSADWHMVCPDGGRVEGACWFERTRVRRGAGRAE